MKPTIYCLVGISGSGKSTLARAMVKEIPNSVIVSRDPLREMLFGYTAETIRDYYLREDLNVLEKQVTDVQHRLVRGYLQGDMSVILDNTHLRLKYINEVKAYGFPVEFIRVPCTMSAAVVRDALRASQGFRSVGAEVICRQHAEYENLAKEFDFKPHTPVAVEAIQMNENNPDAYIFDIDGTLAINKGRGPFEWHRVGEDDINGSVAAVLSQINESGAFVFVLSGRDSVCRPETTAWLKKYGIQYDDLYMRAKGDNRKDSVVKEEFWRELAEKYNIVALFDDRAQVIGHARSLGLTVFDIANNQF